MHEPWHRQIKEKVLYGCRSLRMQNLHPVSSKHLDIIIQIKAVMTNESSSCKEQTTINPFQLKPIKNTPHLIITLNVIDPNLGTWSNLTATHAVLPQCVQITITK